MNNKKAFSFVELIVVITIIALISVIWISINSNYTERSKNSKITSDIQTLQNSLEAYKSETQTLPDPKWNGKYFDDASNYVHYDDPTAYWVSGFITEDTIPKKYLWYLPVDPRTEQYYAYGKTLTWAIEFEIAGVNVKDGVYESKVVWNHSWESGPYNLIKEYNWPDFVYDRSTKNFPYNPDERILKWTIWSFSGEVKVNNVVINDTWITTNELKAGDTIEVKIWWEAQIYYSDWSKSYLWASDRASRLTLANMVYKDENNLFTKIQLALDYGTIWTKTSKLDPKSEFEIYTTDTEAAVRGTIFGVSNNGTLWSTKVSVQTWSVEIKKIEYTNTSIDDIIDKLDSGDNIATTNFYYSWDSVNSQIISWQNLSVEMWASSLTPIETIIAPTLPDNDSLSNIQPDIKSIIPWWTVVLELPSSFSGAGMNVMVWTEITNNFKWDANLLTIYWLTGTQEIKICDSIQWDNCTKSVSVTTTLSYSSTCKLWELDFWDSVWCVEQDASLVASWYTLVAYAPYDVAGDLNMYKQGGDTISTESGGILNSQEDNLSESFPTWCEKTDSFCDIDWVKWVFIWTWNTITPDFIKYTNIWDLNLWSNFAVEMSVRGEALKRSGTFYLFNDSVYIRSGIIPSYLKFIIPSSSFTQISTSTFTDLIPNNFYRTIFKSDPVFNKLYIDIKDKNNNYYSSWWILNPINFWNSLYIGSYNNTISQWNDIIDYVKIYKK